MKQKKSITYWGRLTRRLGAEVYEKALRENDAAVLPKRNAALLFAQAFSLLILISPILVAGFGCIILTFDFPNILTMLVGGTLLALAVFLWPKHNKNNKNTYYREDLPITFALIDQISSELGAAEIDGIHISADYNAYYTEFTRPDERILGIGMQLWGALTPRERIAIIAHELGHSVNNDPARTALLAKAFDIIGQWRNILHYDQLDEGIIGIILSLFYGVMNFMLDLFEGILAKLLFWESQAAEYRADKCAVNVAGSDACKAMLEKLLLSDLLDQRALELHPTERTTGSQLLTQMSNSVMDVSEDVRGRMVREKFLEEHTIDSTHPPTKFRIEYAESFKGAVPLVFLTKAESNNIDAELRLARDSAGEQLLSEMLKQ